MINNFFTNNYEDIQLMAKKVCKSHHEWEEVCSYSVLKFMEHERCQELIEAGRAMNFLSGIMHRSFYSSTSSYHYDIRQKGVMYSLPPSTQLEQPDISYNLEEDNVLDVIKTILEEMISESKETWFIAVLFGMWIDTPNFSKIARETGVPRTSVSRAVGDAKVYIKKELKLRGYDDTSI